MQSRELNVLDAISVTRPLYECRLAWDTNGFREGDAICFSPLFLKSSSAAALIARLNSKPISSSNTLWSKKTILRTKPKKVRCLLQTYASNDVSTKTYAALRRYNDLLKMSPPLHLEGIVANLIRGWEVHGNTFRRVPSARSLVGQSALTCHHTAVRTQSQSC